MENSNKNQSKSSKKIFLLLILLIFIIMGILLKFYGYNFESVYQYSKHNKKELSNPQDIYSSYDVDYKMLGDSHYVFIEDLYSQGRKNSLKEYANIFRMDIAIQTTDKRKADVIADNIDVIINSVRHSMKYLEVSDISEAIVSQNIKRNITDRIRTKFGEDYIEGIYFEEFIGQ